MRVKVKLPEGAKIDRNRLAVAIKAAIAGDGDPEKIWHLNDVPAIAQLEESLYEAGTQDVARAWEETAHLLGLPAAPGQPVLSKAVETKESPVRLKLDDGDLKERVRSAFLGGVDG